MHTHTHKEFYIANNWLIKMLDLIRQVQYLQGRLSEGRLELWDKLTLLSKSYMYFFFCFLLSLFFVFFFFRKASAMLLKFIKCLN